jgi:hypothetical protein
MARVFFIHDLVAAVVSLGAETFLGCSISEAGESLHHPPFSNHPKRRSGPFAGRFGPCLLPHCIETFAGVVILAMNLPANLEEACWARGTAGVASALPLQFGRTDVRDQRQEDSEPGSVGGSGIELDSSGKQCCSIKALKALCLAFSRRSCSVSFPIRSLSLFTRKISLSSCFILSSCCILRGSNCILRCS